MHVSQPFYKLSALQFFKLKVLKKKDEIECKLLLHMFLISPCFCY